MNRFIAAGASILLGAALAVGAAVGAVAALERTPEQPNTPLISYENGSGRN